MNRREFFRTILGLAAIVIPAKLIGVNVEVAEPEVFEKNFFQAGFKGDQILETGYVYAPYIPLYQSLYYSQETKCWERLDFSTNQKE